ncbi:MAG: signal peptidase I [Nanoarchaeota archaeon]
MNRLLLIVVGLLVVGCSVAEKRPPADIEQVRMYLQLQEALVDIEEEAVLHPGTGSSDPLSIHSDLVEVTRQIESQNPQSIVSHENTRFTGEIPSPKDRIKEEQVSVYRKRVVINIDNAYEGFILDTNSMDPLIDAGTTTLAVKPDSPDDVQEGDIILFTSDESEYNIIHRVIYVGDDEEGRYYITRGDNNPAEDPGKVRFENITAVVIGILY